MLPGVGLDELRLDVVPAFLQVGDAGPQAEAAEQLQRLDWGDAVTLLHVGEDSLRLGAGMGIVWVVVVASHGVSCYPWLKGCGAVY